MAKVTIALPVYNAEPFLEETVDSLLAQTFSDFELVISDNASTDGTREICEQYVIRDDRVRYSRNLRNIGAHRNYNKLFHRTEGRLFKWAAADDTCAPDFLKRCIETLEERPDCVLSYARAALIDVQGNPLPTGTERARVEASDVEVRFGDCLNPMKHWQAAVFGVIRRSALDRTRLLGSYAASDRVLMAHLALLGSFHEVPEVLFYRRHYEGNIGIGAADNEFYNPGKRAGFFVPEWRVLRETLRNIRETDLDPETRRRARRVLRAWAWRRRGVFWKQFKTALHRTLYPPPRPDRNGSGPKAGRVEKLEQVREA